MKEDERKEAEEIANAIARKKEEAMKKTYEEEVLISPVQEGEKHFVFSIPKKDVQVDLILLLYFTLF